MASAAIGSIAAVRALGVRVALDDFGTGYSALSTLRRLEIDTVKLDRSFVQDVVWSPRDANLAAAIVDLGHALGLDVVAEGIEDAQQARALLAVGCERAQGWHFGRPVPVEALQAAQNVRWPLTSR